MSKKHTPSGETKSKRPRAKRGYSLGVVDREKPRDHTPLGREWLAERCRMRSPVALDLLSELMAGEHRATPGDRLKAATLILAYGFGKPTDHIEQKTTNENPRFADMSLDDLIDRTSEILDGLRGKE